MGENTFDKMAMRRNVYMAAVAEQVEKDLYKNGSFNLERLGNPMDPKVQERLDRRGQDLIERDKAGEPGLYEMLKASVTGAAWVKSIATAAVTIKEIEAQPPGSDGLVDILLRHADMTDSILTPPVRGTMIPERLLSRLSFKGAELASVNKIMSKDLIDAVMDRIEHICPAHPMRRLVSHVSLFLSMIATSPRDAEDAINMASAFLGRFRDEGMLADLSDATEAAAEASELHRCWILQLMTTARFRMANTEVVISVEPNLLRLVEATNGVIRKGAATVAVPLAGYKGDARYNGSAASGTRH